MTSYEGAEPVRGQSDAGGPPVSARPSRRESSPPRDAGEPRTTFQAWKKTLARLEREFLRKALQEHGGNVSRAARALGMHRSTLQRLMRRHNLRAA